MIAEQVHNKFKVFMGPLDGDSTLGALADEVAAFAAREGVLPRALAWSIWRGWGR